MPSRVWSVFSLIHLIFTTTQTTSTSLRNPSTPRNRNPRLTGLNHEESYNSNKKPRGRGLHTGWMQYCLCIIRSAILTQAPPLWSAGRHSLTSRHKYLTEISPCFFSWPEMHSTLVSKPVPSNWHGEARNCAEDELHKQIWSLLRKHQRADEHWVANNSLSSEWFIYCVHLAEKKAEVCGGVSNFSEVTQLVSGRARVWIQFCLYLSPHNSTMMH